MAEVKLGGSVGSVVVDAALPALAQAARAPSRGDHGDDADGPPETCPAHSSLSAAIRSSSGGCVSNRRLSLES